MEKIIEFILNYFYLLQGKIQSIESVFLANIYEPQVELFMIIGLFSLLLAIVVLIHLVLLLTIKKTGFTPFLFSFLFAFFLAIAIIFMVFHHIY